MRPPLTLYTLKEIQTRRRDDEDVMALLWEIKRMQTLLVRSHQLICMMRPGGPVEPVLRDELLPKLQQEPAVVEIELRHQRMLAPDT